MELNNMDILSDEICDIVERVYANRIGAISIYDIIDEPNYHTFKLKFRIYNFAGVIFQYENDLFEIYVFFNGEEGLLLSKENSHYSEISDWDSYLKVIMTKIESYIPEKYLKAKGWL